MGLTGVSKGGSIASMATFAPLPDKPDNGYTPDYGWSYINLIETTDVKVVLESSDDDYQGNTIALVKQGRRWGILEFGWGSCSGCDALQACYTVADYEELRSELYEGITWFNTLPALRKFVRDHDWGGSFWSSSTYTAFQQQVKDYRVNA